MTAEFEDHSAKLLFTQPLKRMNIITSKLWTAICSYVLIVAVIWLTVFVVGGVFGDNGTFDYPILIEQNGELAFIATADYIIYGLVSISVMMVGMISLYLLLGLFFKQTIATLFVLVVIIVGGYGGASLISWDFFAWLNPFQYVFPTEPILHQNGTAWYQGLPVVLMLSLLFYGLAVKKISKSRIA
ncbi:hypothetical protein JNUCC1_02538 [Lentibacillus sp. JNUCC-1]|uniref:hypothetical protein n=1 Tax=Lentibacillus sp. JNUCC-1 TaxID=2654513 RepID=UPI0012E89460|nr:hypothetical protein [Lentibacillus sp. JNUCC-1]MUV38684.1 hypothetical protein [Lentibacillus sp. JNUCC-1]